MDILQVHDEVVLRNSQSLRNVNLHKTILHLLYSVWKMRPAVGMYTFCVERATAAGVVSKLFFDCLIPTCIDRRQQE